MDIPIPIPIPPIPNEVITEILLCLGKNDLLNCRLVNASWNELTLKILRNPKYAHEHELTETTITKFIEFSKERDGEGEEWILQFHLNFRHILLVAIEDEEDEEEEEEEKEPTTECHLIHIYIQHLQIRFGKNCVSALSLSHHSASSSESVKSVKVLMSILTLIAPSVIRLNLSEFQLSYQEQESTKMKEMLQKTHNQLIFPNLSFLVSCPPARIYFDQVVGEQQSVENEINSFLIEKSLNLKELEVVSTLDLMGTEERMGGLRKLVIVEELEYVDELFDLLSVRPLSSSTLRLPLLKDLSFTYSERLIDPQILNDFLSSLSTSLQSLTIVFQDIPTHPFPRLPHLRFLAIHVSIPFRVRVLVDQSKLNLNSETFPVLESMDISTNVEFKSTDPTSESSQGSNKEEDWSLKSVRRIVMRVVNSPFNPLDVDQMDWEDVNIHWEFISRASAKEYVDHIHGLFPNMTSLTLVNQNDRHEEYVGQLLNAFVQSEGAHRIQELQIQDCQKNYLGQILSGLDLDRQPRIVIENMSLDVELLYAIEKAFQGFSGSASTQLSVDKQMEVRDGVETNRMITCKAPIHFQMTGVEKIQLSALKEFYRLGFERESNQKNLFLMSLPKHLPHLRQIEISERMFGNDQDVWRQQILNVRDKFPDLIIKITH